MEDGIGGPRCAGCGVPLVRRTLPNGALEGLTDFLRRSHCSARCRRSAQTAVFRAVFRPPSAEVGGKRRSIPPAIHPRQSAKSSPPPGPLADS